MKRFLVISILSLVTASAFAHSDGDDRGRNRGGDRGGNRGGYDHGDDRRDDRRDDRDRDRRNQGKHCNCVEAERRLRGLSTALYNLNLSRYECEDIRSAASRGEQILDQVNYNTPYEEQARLCSLSAQAVDRVWVRVQPELGRRGLDQPTYCEYGGRR